MYKPFPKSFTVFGDNILMQVSLSETFDEPHFLGPNYFG
jgi:hypothetical protein